MLTRGPHNFLASLLFQLVVTENVATSFEEETTAVVSPDGVKILQSESVSLQQQRTTRRAQSDGGAAQLGIAEKALEAAAAAAAMRTTDPGNDSDALFFVGRLQAGGGCMPLFLCASLFCPWLFCAHSNSIYH
jgi:hypothetical protein